MSKSLSLKSKLLAMNVVTLIALLLLFAVLLVGERQQLMADRQDKLKSLVETAHTLVAGFEQRSRHGQLTQDEAQRAALSALQGLRYGDSEYFWVNDFKAVVLMHPIKPELNGKDMSSLKDPKGKTLFVEFGDTVRRGGAGFVDYLWPKPGSSEPVPKLSYVKGFQPWGWIIGTGVYIDDVDAAFRESALHLLLWGLLIGGGITLGLILVSRDVLRSLGGDPDYAKRITQRIACGDLSTEVEFDSRHPASLLASMSSMLVMLRSMVQEIESNAVQVAEASSELSATSQHVLERVEQQSDAASSMAASMEEISVSISQVGENAREANQFAIAAGNISEGGKRIILAAANEMHKISDLVRESAQSIQQLGDQSDQITSIVNTIREIADQTNLLALNAAIEAARAGEQGRGFAVVADEVRKLAERTSRSTTEITNMVSKIQSGARNAVSSMEEGVAQVVEGVSLAGQAGDSIHQIHDGAARVTDVVRDISASIDEQGMAATNIAQSLERIAQMAEESAIAVRETATAAAHLHGLSEGLHRTVGQFKTR